ncbi:MAG: phosphoribosylglycinamide formyltransferase [Myxococcales bacterium]|nr:phosphoribosylglycinamide formyltransferase [Myxococcota bacterium]MDW8280786.1 phosphoribosylglycinamide formyltransferase [Myxococcales bacterium]
MKGLGVLVSGQGTNLQALIDAQARGELGPAVLRVVVSNVPGAPALDRALRAGLPAVLVDHRPFGSDRAAFEEAVLDVLREHGVELVALAGFMRLLGPTFLAAFPDRVLNVHPSLLPAFPGMNAIRQALEHGVRITGCTIHLVDQGCDTGPILLQAAVPVLPDDDEATLAARVHAEEHRLYPQAVRLLAEGRIIRQGARARILAE